MKKKDEEVWMPTSYNGNYKKALTFRRKAKRCTN